jgi:hypothetical protein
VNEKTISLKVINSERLQHIFNIGKWSLETKFETLKTEDYNLKVLVKILKIGIERNSLIFSRIRLGIGVKVDKFIFGKDMSCLQYALTTFVLSLTVQKKKWPRENTI